jgi:hypothetical protein
MHNDIVEATHMGSQVLVDSINKMHETSLLIENKHAKTQERIYDNQLDYFKGRDKLINKTHINIMKTITCLTSRS